MNIGDRVKFKKGVRFIKRECICGQKMYYTVNLAEVLKTIDCPNCSLPIDITPAQEDTVYTQG